MNIKVDTQNEPSHEIMVLFVLPKLILKTRMRSHPVNLDVWFLVEPFVYFHTLCVRSAKALARLRGCTGSPEPSLFAYVISTIISWAGSNYEIKPCQNKQYSLTCNWWGLQALTRPFTNTLVCWKCTFSSIKPCTINSLFSLKRKEKYTQRLLKRTTSYF